MATLRDIRRRLRTVQKTQQITSAMRMVAAAKLRRAQDAILAARPYSQQLWATMYEIGRREKELDHPWLKPHEARERLEVVVITSDRGLCGAYNANILKAAEAAIRERSDDFREIAVSAAGRKGVEYFRRRRTLEQAWSIGPSVTYELAVAIGEHVGRRYETGEVDEVVAVFSEFVSAITQRPQVVRLLPLIPEFTRVREYEEGAGTEPHHIEPSPEAVFQRLVPLALEFSIYRALLENQAGFFAAQMTAMESATRNTEDLIRSLSLQFNRARQAAITKELVEIVSGAEALT
jgi:F-type H+-transporting ATPase subunit gamma